MAELCSIDAMKAAKSVVVEVRLRRVRELMVRTWLAARLFKLAGWVAGVRVFIKLEDAS